MQIVRYEEPSTRAPRPGLRVGERLVEIPRLSSLAELWALGPDELRALVEEAAAEGSSVHGGARLLAPVDGRTEVWACGVTYEISRQARVEESERSADVYERVYEAERPELFFKSVPWKVVGDRGSIAIREDSTLDVPEPELAVVVGAGGQLLGYTICDDVSSRSIEGENPLYLPQAKTYLGACALGPGVTPAWEVADPYSLRIELHIERGGALAWSGAATTALLHRRLEELVAFLRRADVFPDGAVLSTGTCLVPPAPWSLEDGDTVRIQIEGLGMLTTKVVRGVDGARAAMR